MTTNLHEITNRALHQWIEVTGVDPEKDKSAWTRKLGDQYSNWNLESLNNYIVEAQDLDQTGLTAFMVVRAIARNYVANHQFDALSVLEASDEMKERLNGLSELIKLVDDHDAIAEVEAFQNDLRKAAEHYGVADKLDELINNPSEVAHIRRDALVCTTLLDRHTFAKGERAKGTLKYNENVLQFWNVNSMVRAAQIQPANGISIVMIKDDQVETSSFFCFLVRDGENITVWTDKPDDPHPMHKHMSRSRARGRELASRAARLRFPYQLLDVKVTKKGDPIKIPRNALVRTNIDAVTISRMADLEPDQILWAIMALDTLKEQDHSEKLSVTGEGLTVLPAGSDPKALPPGYSEAKRLKTADVNSETIDEQLDTEDHRSYRSTGVNDWMEDRYNDQVDERVLNLATPQVSDKALPGSVDDDEDAGPRTEMVLVGSGGKRVDVTDLLPESNGLMRKGSDMGNAHPMQPSLIGMDPTSFGSPEEMESDRLWIARYNQAQALAMAAKAEFDERKDEVVSWFTEQVNGNVDNLLDAMVRGQLISVGQTVNGGLRRDSLKREEQNVIKWHRFTKGDSPTSGHYSGVWLRDECADVRMCQKPKNGREYGTRKNPLRSCLSDTRATVWALFVPHTAEGIAAIAGCEVSELPELLEHWQRQNPYGGNSILSRTDPLDSLVGNPWRALQFRVLIGISKREWNKMRKGLGDEATEVRFQIEKYSRSDRTIYWDYEDDDDD